MKKTCYVLLVAALLAFAPGAFAADGAVLSFDALFARLVMLLSDLGDDSDLAPLIEPVSRPVAAVPASDAIPPNSSADNGEELEMGWQIPPNG